jgi:hypothetical protein
MRMLPMISMLRRRPVGYVLVAVLGATLHGCGVNEIEIPELSGPSERAESLIITATPDLLVADGRSFAVVRATFRDRNAEPLRGRAIAFHTADESGRFASIGTLSSDVAVTDGNGIAQIIYTAPPRTDATANQTVLVQARAIGNDFNGQEGGLYRTARIELRSAEPRLFPLNPTNNPPKCFFIVEAPLGLRAPVTVLFQTTSSDEDGTIVRYEWRFSDDPNPTLPGTYSPDTAHVYRQAGTWRVTHTVTDDDGGQSSCFVDLDIS